MNPEEEFVSEPIEPLGESFDAAAMGRGEPGLPERFRWRGRDIQVAAVLEKWNQSKRIQKVSNARLKYDNGN